MTKVPLVFFLHLSLSPLRCNATHMLTGLLGAIQKRLSYTRRGEPPCLSGLSQHPFRIRLPRTDIGALSHQH